MKARVINKFKDKLNNLQVREVGDIIEVSEDRFEKLRNSPLGRFVEKTGVKEEAIEEKVILNDLNKRELIDYSSKYKLELDMRMTKEEIIEEIKKVESK